MQSAVAKILEGYLFSPDMEEIIEILYTKSVSDLSLKLVKLFSRNKQWMDRKWHAIEMLHCIESDIFLESLRCRKGGLYMKVLDFFIDELLDVLYCSSEATAIFLGSLHKVASVGEELDVENLLHYMLDKVFMHLLTDDFGVDTSIRIPHDNNTLFFVLLLKYLSTYLLGYMATYCTSLRNISSLLNSSCTRNITNEERRGNVKKYLKYVRDM